MILSCLAFPKSSLLGGHTDTENITPSHYLASCINSQHGQELNRQDKYSDTQQLKADSNLILWPILLHHSADIVFFFFMSASVKDYPAHCSDAVQAFTHSQIVIHDDPSQGAIPVQH